MARILIALLIITLTIYTFIDCARTPASDVPARIPKPVWLVLIFLIPVIGPAVWLYFKYQAVFADNTPISPSEIAEKLRGKDNTPGKPVAPDDDPEFLARLDAQNRRKAYEQRKAQEKAKAEEEKKRDHRDDAGSSES